MPTESQVKSQVDELARQLNLKGYLLVYLDDGQKAKIVGEMGLSALAPILMDSFLKKAMK